MIDRAARIVARFGAVMLLLATAALCGFIVGRSTAPAPPAPKCANPGVSAYQPVGSDVPVVAYVC